MLILEVEGVGFGVNIDKFTRGNSVFVPAINEVALKKYLKARFRDLKIPVLVKISREDGVKGCRVWRL